MGASLLLVLLFAASCRASGLYGLTLVTNGPATMGLVQVNGTSGDDKEVGPAHKEEFGTGDLVAIAHGLLFYLGDTSAGTTLVGVNLTTGAEECSKVIALAEIGFVGIGQSLDFDAVTDTLVVSGVNPNRSAHAVYRSGSPPSGTSCGGHFEHIGTFGDSAFLPMLHASTMDAHSQRLFVDLALGKQGPAGVGVIDLTGKKPMRVIPEPPPHGLCAMHFDAKANRLKGIFVAAGAPSLQLHSLNPEVGGKWDAPKDISGVPSDWNMLAGNAGTVSTFDAASRSLFFLAGTQTQAGDEVVYLAAMDTDTAALTAHPKLGKIGLGGSGLQALEFDGDE